MMKSVSQKKPTTFSSVDVGKAEPDVDRVDEERTIIPLPKTACDDSSHEQLRLKIT